MLVIGVLKRRPNSHLFQRGPSKLLAWGQLRPPLPPERISPHHLLPVESNPLDTLSRNRLLPLRAFLRTNLGVRFDHRPEHIKVMHFAKRILQVAQVTRPAFVPFGQKILYCVAKTLDANSQLVIGRSTAITQRRAMQRVRIVPALQREILESQALEGHTSCSCSQFAIQV